MTAAFFQKGISSIGI